MCYCEENDKYKILKDLDEENVPEDALLTCWSSICRVRGEFGRPWIQSDKWRRLCSRRGYLLYRRNSRGF